MTQEEKKNTEAAAPEAQEPAEQNAGTMAATALPRNQNEAQDKARPEAKAEGAPDEKPEEKAGEKPAEKPRRRRRPLTLVAGGMLVVLCAVAIFHLQILQEERFLLSRKDIDYKDYYNRVHRYL